LGVGFQLAEFTFGHRASVPRARAKILIFGDNRLRSEESISTCLEAVMILPECFTGKRRSRNDSRAAPAR